MNKSNALENQNLTGKYKYGGLVFGDYIKISENPSNKEIAEAKAVLLKQFHGFIDALVDNYDDFFIVKKTLDGEHTSVGWKIVCPTLGRNK